MPPAAAKTTNVVRRTVKGFLRAHPALLPSPLLEGVVDLQVSYTTATVVLTVEHMSFLSSAYRTNIKHSQTLYAFPATGKWTGWSFPEMDFACTAF